jgi:integrase
MARPPKPFPYRGGWYTDFGGTRKLLAKGGPEALPRAQRALARLMAAKPDCRPAAEANMTVADVIESFLDVVVVEKAPATYRHYRCWLKLLREDMGQKRLADVTRNMAMSYRDRLIRRRKKGKPQYAPNSVNHALTAACILWQWVMNRDETLARNPFSRIPMMVTQPRRRVITDDEFTRLMRAADCTAIKHLLFALRYTGARPSELRALTWDMIDTEKQVCVLSRHKTSRTQKKKKARIIPLTPPLLRLIEQRRELYGHQSPYVFLTKRGRPWQSINMSMRLNRVCKRAGIVPDDSGETITAYSNRHTFLTTAARAGVTGPQLVDLGGWTGTAMLTTYVHLTEADVATSGAKAAELLKPKPRKKPGS